jgi:hypothetical protein
MESWVRVAATSVATPCVDMPASYLVPSLNSCTLYVASFVGVSTLESGCEYRVVWRLDAPLGLIWNWSQRCDGRCRDARRRFVSVVSCGILRLICSKYGILCRRRNGYHRGSRRGFVCVMSYVIPTVTYRWWKKNLPLNPKSSPRLEPRTVFGFVTSVPVISSPKRINFVLAPFFSCA